MTRAEGKTMKALKALLAGLIKKRSADDAADRRSENWNWPIKEWVLTHTVYTSTAEPSNEPEALPDPDPLALRWIDLPQEERSGIC